jgi:hypothetical protein
MAIGPFDKDDERFRQLIGPRYGMSLEEMIEDLNPVIRGWDNYHTAVPPNAKRFRKLNGFVRERMRILLRRKYSDQSRGCRRVQNNLLVRLELTSSVEIYSSTTTVTDKHMGKVVGEP